MSDASLTMLVDEVRGKTLMLLEGVSPREARWAPQGLQNSILWHAGHCYVLAEWLALSAAGHAPQAPPGWYEMFSWDSRPSAVSGDAWPALADIVAALREQHGRMRKVVEGLSDADLSRPAEGRSGRTVRYYLVHALHDEACHGGEIWLLRKVLAAG
ncbi:MAG: DinB family protein [Planctomycetia bacterium]|nr:DinB family protein [Planctomycetia bacterium]